MDSVASWCSFKGNKHYAETFIRDSRQLKKAYNVYNWSSPRYPQYHKLPKSLKPVVISK